MLRMVRMCTRKRLHLCGSTLEKRERQIHWSLSVSWPDFTHFSHSSVDSTHLLCPRGANVDACVWKKVKDTQILCILKAHLGIGPQLILIQRPANKLQLRNTGHTTPGPQMYWFCLFFTKCNMTPHLVCGLPLSFCLGILVMGEIKRLKLICQGSQSASHSQQS